MAWTYAYNASKEHHQKREKLPRNILQFLYKVQTMIKFPGILVWMIGKSKTRPPYSDYVLVVRVLLYVCTVLFIRDFPDIHGME